MSTASTTRPQQLARIAIGLFLLALVAAYVACDARAATTSRLTGIYVPLHFDGGRQDGKQSHWLRTNHGMVRLQLDGVRPPRPGARIAVEGLSYASGIDVSGLQTMAAPEPAAPSTGTAKALVIQVRFGGAIPSATRAQASDFVFGTGALSTASWVQKASFGKLTLQGTVTPVLTIADPGSCTSSGPFLDLLAQRADAAAASAGYNLSSYPIRIINTPLSSICEARGWGSLVDGHTWIANGLVDQNSGYERFIVVHELGHNFGLAHSHGLECGSQTVSDTCLSSSDSKNEYGDSYDAMGNNRPGWGANAIASYSARQMEKVGWLAKPALTVTTSGTYTISPLASPTPTYAPALKISTATRSYTIETRQAVGVDSFLSGLAPTPTEGVLIHMRNDLPGADSGPLLLDMTPASGSEDGDFYDATLTTGRAFTDPRNEFSVRVVSVGPGGATVAVTFAGSPADTTAPIVTTPLEQIAVPSKITSTTIPVTLTWSGSDVSGVAAYELTVSTNGGAFLQDTSITTQTQKTYSLTVGSKYQFRIRAKDGAGNWSGYRYSAPLTPGITDEKTAFPTLGSGWTRYSWASAFNGTFIETGRAGDWATYTFTGRDIVLVAPKYPTGGRAEVFCDGTSYGYADLYAATTTGLNTVFWCRFDESKSHTVKIVVEGTSGRPWFDIDAFAVLS